MRQALLLAGGKSERFGQNKLLISIGETSLLEYHIKKLLLVVDQVVVVTGRYHEAIASALGNRYGQSLRLVYNPAYEQGMFSSVLAGASSVTGELLITPADCAFYELRTLQALFEVDGPIVVPSYNYQGGHPIRLQAQVVEALKEAPVTSNLKAFRNQYPITWVPVTDEGILKDLDTQEAYQALLEEQKGEQARH